MLQGLTTIVTDSTGAIQRRQRLGGTLNYYYRQAGGKLR
jgi:hypothetical protein